jgi:hypothetical protein
MGTQKSASDGGDTRTTVSGKRLSAGPHGSFASAVAGQNAAEATAAPKRMIARADQAAAARPKQRVRSFVLKLATLVCSLTIILLAAEGATRLFSDVTPPLLCNHPVLGTTYLPDFAANVFIPECDQKVFLRFNSLGMRGGPVTVEKPEGVRRVAVIGDSFIAAVATDEDKTIVRLLENQLNQSDPSTRWEVINFGVSASSTGQELVLYRELVRKYKPDVVVCAYCVMNDLGDNCRRLTSSRARIYFDVDESGELVQQQLSAKRATLNAWLNRNSRFYVWQRHATQKAINSLRHGAHSSVVGGWLDLGPADRGGQGIYNTSPDGDLAYAWQVTEKLIETMHNEVRADGAEFLLVALPTGLQVCDDLFFPDEEAGVVDRYYPDQRLSEICGRIGAPILLLTDRFRDASPHHSSEYEAEWLHYDGVGHFNDRGNAVAADALADALRLRYARAAMRDQLQMER